jgi:hypothetical protein
MYLLLVRQKEKDINMEERSTRGDGELRNKMKQRERERERGWNKAKKEK